MNSDSSSDDEQSLTSLLTEEKKLKAELKEYEAFNTSTQKALIELKQKIAHERKREKLLEACLADTIKKRKLDEALGTPRNKNQIPEPFIYKE